MTFKQMDEEIYSFKLIYELERVRTFSPATKKLFSKVSDRINYLTKALCNSNAFAVELDKSLDRVRDEYYEERRKFTQAQETVSTLLAQNAELKRRNEEVESFLSLISKHGPWVNTPGAAR